MQAFKGRTLVADWSLAKSAYSTQSSTDGAPAPHTGDTYGDAADDTPATVDATAAADGEASASGDDEAMAFAPLAEAAGDSSSEEEEQVDDGSSSEDEEAEASSADEAEEGMGRADSGTGAASDGEQAGVSVEERALLERVLRSVTAAPSSSAAAASGTAAVPAAKKAGSKEGGKGQKGGDSEAAGWEGGRSEAPAEDGKGSGVIRQQVFVRNVPLDASSIELQTRLQRFGRIKACRCAPFHAVHHLFAMEGTANAAGAVAGSC